MQQEEHKPSAEAEIQEQLGSNSLDLNTDQKGILTAKKANCAELQHPVQRAG